MKINDKKIENGVLCNILKDIIKVLKEDINLRNKIIIILLLIIAVLVCFLVKLSIF